MDATQERTCHPRGGPGGPGPSPWDLLNTRFSGFLLLNYVLYNFAACVRMIFAMWEGRGSLQHGSVPTMG